MRKKEKYIDIVVIFFISIISGIISSYFLDGGDSLIIGISSLLILSLLNIQIKLKDQNIIFSKILFMISSIKDKGSYQELLLKYWLKSIDKVTEIGLWGEGDNFWDLWIDCISSSRKSWVVTNYATLNEVWDLAWSDKVVNIQKAKLSSDNKIERIFIFDSKEEFENATHYLVLQAKTGIKVKWLLKSDLIKSKSIIELIKKIGTIDFAIVDDSWIFRTFLDKNKNVKRVNAIKNDDLLNSCKIVMEEVQKKSIIITPN